MLPRGLIRESESKNVIIVMIMTLIEKERWRETERGREREGGEREGEGGREGGRERKREGGGGREGGREGEGEREIIRVNGR